jgi:hypothetical protein
MSAAIKPVVLNMTLCEEARSDPARPGKPTVVGLLWLLRWPGGLTEALRLEKLTVLLILTGGRGTGRGKIGCINEETGVPIVLNTEEKPIQFEGKDPTLPYAFSFVVHDCYT